MERYKTQENARFSNSSFNTGMQQAEVIALCHRPQARVRLICFQHAGATEAAFDSWSDLLPAEIEVSFVRKPTLSDYRQLVEALSSAVLASALESSTLPYALFGHSLGGLVAFGVARQLRRLGAPQPRCLLIAAASAPQILTQPAVAGPPPERWTVVELVAYLRQVRGTPQAVLKNPIYLERLLPRMQVDLTVRTSYSYTDEPPFDYPVGVFGGRQDEIPVSSLVAWSEQTAERFTLQLFGGNHFFLQHPQGRLQFLQALGSACLGWIEGPLQLQVRSIS